MAALVKSLPNLEELKLGHTLVTNAGMVHLQGLAKLRELKLNRSQITDAGLAPLKKLGQLQMLELAEVDGVTAAGVRDLQQALPDLKIDR